jgi:hypothetical protein
MATPSMDSVMESDRRIIAELESNDSTIRVPYSIPPYKRDSNECVSFLSLMADIKANKITELNVIASMNSRHVN